ncbi:MAG: Mrp/NBP35 family ATP-binding protein [Bdellovibrionales bacterium]|nr:Mrp/NBP35 family ATP-binding protein [Bdellovibrionales bacterium]
MPQMQPKAPGLPGVRHIIAVSSGKGGVGKSTVSANLACALAAAGKRVGLMDADIMGPNMPIMMGVTEEPKIQKTPTGGEEFIPPTAQGVKVMSMGFLVEPDQPVVWRGPMLHNLLTQFAKNVNWGELDYLVIDFPPGTGDVQISLSQLLPITGAVMVTTPQEVAMQDVRRAWRMWSQVRVPVMGVVENMSYFICAHGEKYEIFGKGGGEILKTKFSTELLARVPIEIAVREGGDLGRPVVVAKPESESARAFTELAQKVMAGAEQLASAQPATVEIGKF